MLRVLDATVGDLDGRIERAAARINETSGETGLQHALTIGRVVIEEVYEGGLSGWRQRGTRDTSLRRLAADPRLTISASALYRAIALYELKVRLADHPMWQGLTVCHIRAVLGLPEAEQLRLLDLAIQHCWTIHAMDEAAASSREKHRTSRGGRPRKNRVTRAIEDAERALLDEDEALEDPEALREMSSKQRTDLSRRLSLITRRCEALASALSHVS
jgi:hypothetical protein